MAVPSSGRACLYEIVALARALAYGGYGYPARHLTRWGRYPITSLAEGASIYPSNRLSMSIPNAFLALPRFARFILIGGVNTAFGYGVFVVFYALLKSHRASITMATIIGVLFNYLTTGRYVFSNYDYKLIFRFISAYAVILILNIMIVEVMLSAHVPALGAQVIALPFIVLVSYCINAKFVFRAGIHVRS
ncbi:MAG TPA: GtrA family protein [Chthoniobacterales bacterium]